MNGSHKLSIAGIIFKTIRRSRQSKLAVIQLAMRVLCIRICIRIIASKLASISIQLAQYEQSRHCSGFHHCCHHRCHPSIRAMRSRQPGPTDPTAITDKRPIVQQEPIPGPPFESSQRAHPPLGLRKRSPLLWNPVPYHPVVPCRHCHTSPCRPGGMPMKITSPPQHGSLTIRQQPIVGPPCMHP